MLQNALFAWKSAKTLCLIATSHTRWLHQQWYVGLLSNDLVGEGAFALDNVDSSLHEVAARVCNPS